MEASRQIRHPNRDLPESKQTRTVVVGLLLISAGLITVVTVAGWSVLQGAHFIQVAYALIYLTAAVFVARWNRGTLPLSSALAMVLIIIASVAAPGWFSRGSAGFEEPLISSDFLGILTLLLVPLQVLVIVYSLRGFRQEWNVEA